MVKGLSTVNYYGTFAGYSYRKPCGTPHGEPLSMLWLRMLLRPIILKLRAGGVSPRMLADDLLLVAKGVCVVTVEERRWPAPSVFC
eukprot:7642177-Alexandrium_andersonii.AAC.1